MVSTNEREYETAARAGSDERESNSDDVEALASSTPPSERPPADRSDEGDDVETHVLSEAPSE